MYSTCVCMYVASSYCVSVFIAMCPVGDEFVVVNTKRVTFKDICFTCQGHEFCLGGEVLGARSEVQGEREGEARLG